MNSAVKRDTTAWIVTIVALILLAASIAVVVNMGIPALQNVSIPVTVLPRNAVAGPTALPTASPIVIGTPAAEAGVRATSVVMEAGAPPAGGAAVPPVVVNLPPFTCANPISGADRTLFDAANGALENATSHKFHFDLNFAVDAGAAGNGSLRLGGDGFLQNRLDGGIEFQVDTQNAFVYPPAPGQPNITAAFEVPLRFDMENLYFRIVVPDRNVDTQWFSIGFQDILNEATDSAFMPPGLLPADITASATEDGSFMGLDISALEGETGFFDLFELSKFICTERLANSDGKAHFSSRIDVAGFLQSSEFANAIDSILAMSGGAPGSGAMISAMVPMLLAQYITRLDVTVDHYVNLEDNNLASVVLDVNVGSQLSDSSGGVQPVNFRVSGTINYSDYNRPQTLDIPPNPTHLERLDDIQKYLPSS